MIESIFLSTFCLLMFCQLGYAIVHKGIVSIASYVTLFYTFAAICAVIYYQNPLYGVLSFSTHIQLEGTLYLFFVLLIFAIPLFKFPNKLSKISFNEKRFRVVYYSVFIITAISLIFNIASNGFTLHNFVEDFVDVRNDSYYESEERAGFFEGFMTGYLNAFNYFSIPISLLALFVFRYKPFQSTIFFIIAIASPIYNSLVVAGRSEIVNMMLMLGYSFILCKGLISKTVYRGFMSFIIFLGLIVLGYVVFANFLRFENQSVDASFFLWKYTGESIVNFTGVLFPSIIGYTYGTSSFGFFRRLLGLDYTSDLMSLRAFVERKTGTPGYIFYTYIGNFFRDFGAYITALMGIIYCSLMNRSLNLTTIKTDSGETEMKCGTWVLFAFLGNMYLPGVFYFTLYSQVGNIAIILAIALYVFLNKETQDEE